MLTIKNIDKIKGLEITVWDSKWYCHSIIEKEECYTIIAMPMEDGIAVIVNSVFVNLSRIGLTNVEGTKTIYKLDSHSHFSYVTKHDITSPLDLFVYVAREILKNY